MYNIIICVVSIMVSDNDLLSKSLGSNLELVFHTNNDFWLYIHDIIPSFDEDSISGNV